MDKYDKMVMKDLVDYYNVLACPSKGVPKLTPSGNKSKKGLKIRKAKHSDTTVGKN